MSTITMSTDGVDLSVLVDLLGPLAYRDGARATTTATGIEITFDAPTPAEQLALPAAANTDVDEEPAAPTMKAARRTPPSVAKAEQRRQFTAEQKAAAVADIAELGVTAAAERHHVHPSQLRRWHAQARPLRPVPDDPRDRHVCPFTGCREEFANASGLGRHKQAKHGVGTAARAKPSGPQLQCADCDRTFPNAMALGGHRGRAHPIAKGVLAAGTIEADHPKIGESHDDWEARKRAAAAAAL